MATYGRDIRDVMAWTFPQLRLLNRHRRLRRREERRWQLMLASGTLAPEMFDQLWQTLGGEKLGLKSREPAAQPTSQQPSRPGQQSHDVDAEGNVLAPGAPLLSDIAVGKARAPDLIPVRVIEREQEEDEAEGPRPDEAP